jgi:hypothetical protein
MRNFGRMILFVTALRAFRSLPAPETRQASVFSSDMNLQIWCSPS